LKQWENQRHSTHAYLEQETQSPNNPQSPTQTLPSKILMDDTATSERYESAGRITEKQYTGYVNADIAVDHLYRVTVQAIIYEVRSTPTIEYLEGTASFKKLVMVRVS